MSEDIPNRPEFSGEFKKKRKKTMSSPPPMEGELLLPPPTEEKQEKVSYSKEVGPPLAFPVVTGDRVKELARYGMKPEAIAKHIDHPITGKPLTSDVLLAYFEAQYIEGMREGAEETARSVHEQATGQGGKKPNVAASIYRAAQQQDMIGYVNPVSKEVHHSIVENADLRERIKNLSEDDVKQLRAILAKRVESGDVASRASRLRRTKPKREG